MNILGLIPGAVTPLGLLNDKELRVEFYLDSYFKDKLIGVHPNDNTATVWMSSSDLIKIIKNNGNKVEFKSFKNNSYYSYDNRSFSRSSIS